jgi:hypothetical protein
MLLKLNYWSRLTRSVLTLRSSLFWNITQRIVVIPYWRFGINYRTLKKVGPTSPETSVKNYQHTLRNVPEERWSHIQFWPWHRRMRLLSVYQPGNENDCAPLKRCLPLCLSLASGRHFLHVMSVTTLKSNVCTVLTRERNGKQKL